MALCKPLFVSPTVQAWLRSSGQKANILILSDWEYQKLWCCAKTKVCLCRVLGPVPEHLSCTVACWTALCYQSVFILAPQHFVSSPI